MPEKDNKPLISIHHAVFPDKGHGVAEPCDHPEFDSSVTIVRIADREPMAFMAEAKIHCTKCGLRFRFKGLPGGLDWERPACDVHAYTAHLPIEPGSPDQR